MRSKKIILSAALVLVMMVTGVVTYIYLNEAEVGEKTVAANVKEQNLKPLEVSLSSANVSQGDVVSIKVTNMPVGITPTASTSLGMSIFTENNGTYQTFIPIGYLQAIGQYKINVTAGDINKVFDIQVVAGQFEEQHLTVNTSNPVISEASSSKAYQQYRDTIHPFFYTADKTRYWKDNFIQPTTGRISTEFGLLRYTNGSKTPSGHSGIDIAAETGTPVYAPSEGQVVYSDYLLNTGNTIVIEHGGGLKSYYFHMNARNVGLGDSLKKGQKIGEVGTTGYSTGPHLHFEVRIGNQPINPWNLINETGGFFE